MVNGMRTVYPRELNKGFSSKFRENFRLRQESSRVRKVSSQVRQEAPDEGWRSHRPKHCEYNNKDEDNSLNNLENTYIHNISTDVPPGLLQVQLKNLLVIIGSLNVIIGSLHGTLN